MSVKLGMRTCLVLLVLLIAQVSAALPLAACPSSYNRSHLDMLGACNYVYDQYPFEEKERIESLSNPKEYCQGLTHRIEQNYVSILYQHGTDMNLKCESGFTLEKIQEFLEGVLNRKPMNCQSGCKAKVASAVQFPEIPPSLVESIGSEIKKAKNGSGSFKYVSCSFRIWFEVEAEKFYHCSKHQVEEGPEPVVQSEL